MFTYQAESLSQQLVINWHMTEVCNYSCAYCYAKWNKEFRPKELFHDLGKAERLVSHLYDFFKPSSATNPLHDKMEWTSVRLNFAGGEPTLYKDKLLALIKFSKSVGFDVSIITNGSRFSDLGFVEEISPYLSILGLSIDSGESKSNKAIGRVDRKGEQHNMENMLKAVMQAKVLNPSMLLKVNTVVNAVNYSENLGHIIECLKPDKWKILRMLPIVTNDLVVSDEHFDEFIRNHEKFKSIYRVEDNVDMTESYIMVDPLGRFFQNFSSKDARSDYIYSDYILDSSVEAAFKQIDFSAGKFVNRYV